MREAERDEPVKGDDDWSRFQFDADVPVAEKVLEIKASLPELCDTYRWIPRFLLTLRVSQSIRQACHAARIHRSFVYKVKNAHPEFAKAMAEAEEDATDWYVEEARRRALQSSDMLLWNLLKSHRPEIYREPKGNLNVAAVIRIENNGQSRMVRSPSDLTEEELDAMIEGRVTIEGDATALFGDEDDEDDDAT